MKNIDLTNVSEAQEFKKLQPGGYLCGIVKVDDRPGKEYLEVSFDIFAGEFKGYFYNQYKQFNYWPNAGIIRRSYKTSALPFFKSFITALEKSNPGYKFDFDEQKMVKKAIGIVLAEEEYEAKDGSIKTRIYPAQVKSIQAIKDGDFKVPELKKFEGVPKTTSTIYQDFPDANEDIFTPVDDGELPF